MCDEALPILQICIIEEKELLQFHNNAETKATKGKTKGD